MAQHGTAQHSAAIVEGGVATCLYMSSTSSLLCVGVLHHVQVDNVHRAFEARKEYVATWLSAHEAAVLEYDTEGFTFVSFLFEIKGFYSLVHCKWRHGSMSAYGGCLVVVRVRSRYTVVWQLVVVSREHVVNCRWQGLERAGLSSLSQQWSLLAVSGRIHVRTAAKTYTRVW